MAWARATPGRSRSRAWLTSWALVLLFLASLPAVTPRLYASDEIQYFAYLRSLWFDQDLAFDNEYRYFHDRGIARAYGFEETFLVLKTETGRRFNFATIGCALLWAPFYAGADVTVRVLRAAGSPIRRGRVFGALHCSRGVTGRRSTGFSLSCCRSGLRGCWWGASGAATSLVSSCGSAPRSSSICTSRLGWRTPARRLRGAVFVNVWLAVRGDWSRRGCVALGAAAALVVMVREQDVFFVVGPALDFVWRLKDDLAGGWSAAVGRRLRNGAMGDAVFAGCFLPQAAAYLVLNGRLGPPDYIANKISGWRRTPGTCCCRRHTARSSGRP